MKKHVESFLTTVVIWMKVLRRLHLKLLCFPSFHLFFPLSLPPHILSLSPTFPLSPPNSSEVWQVVIYPTNDFFWLHKHCEFNYWTSFQSFFICKSHTILGDTYCLLFLRFWWSISFIKTWVSILSGTNAGISHLCTRVQ